MSAIPRYAGFAVAAMLVAAAISVGGCGAALDPLGSGAPDVGSRTLGGSVPDGEKVVGLVLGTPTPTSAAAPNFGSQTGAPVSSRSTVCSSDGSGSSGSGSGATYVVPVPPGAAAAAGAKVTLGGPDGTSQVTYADANGYFEFPDTYIGTWPITFELATLVNSTQITVSAKGTQLCQVIARLTAGLQSSTTGLTGSLQAAASTTTVRVGGTSTLTASYNGVHTSNAGLIWILKAVAGSRLVPTTDPGLVTLEGGTSLGAVGAEVTLGNERSNTVQVTVCSQ
jgi:hypothetical protein